MCANSHCLASSHIRCIVLSFMPNAFAASSSVRPKKNLTSTSLHHSGLVSQLIQKPVDGNRKVNLCTARGKHILEFFEADELGVGPCPGMINEISPHRSARNGKEMRPVLPIPVLRLH